MIDLLGYSGFVLGFLFNIVVAILLKQGGCSFSSAVLCRPQGTCRITFLIFGPNVRRYLMTI